MHYRSVSGEHSRRQRTFLYHGSFRARRRHVDTLLALVTRSNSSRARTRVGAPLRLAMALLRARLQIRAQSMVGSRQRKSTVLSEQSENVTADLLLRNVTPAWFFPVWVAYAESGVWDVDDAPVDLPLWTFLT